MLDGGKFSVYNGSGGAGGPPPSQVKIPSPINFKFESVECARLSFDDELRQAMEKFHKAKEPSPTKEALKKWVSSGTGKLSGFLDMKLDIKLPTLPKIKFPQFELPKIPFPKLELQLDERLDRLFSKAQEKLEEIKEDLWEILPHEKVSEMVQFVAEIPQNYIIPPALWIYSFIPVEAMQRSFESGIQRINQFLSTTYGFAQRGYSFCERHVKRFMAYLNRKYVLPVANFLERLFRAIGQWFLNNVYPILKRIAVSFYQFTLKVPGYSWRFLKASWRGLKRLTIWLVE